MTQRDISGLQNSSCEILFVFGAARSGTTFLNKFLFRWFDIGTGPEGNFVHAFADRLAKYGDLSDASNMRAMIEDVAHCEMLDIIRNRWPEDIRFDVTPEMLEAELPERSYAGLVYSVFRCVALGQGKEAVGNKFPFYWRYLDLLNALFPTQARYLGIIRDGRDVALSTMRTPWGERNSYTCAKEWEKCADAMHRFQQRIGESRFLIVRYEDLLLDPEKTIPEIASFLGVEMSPERLEGALNDAKESAAKFATEKWRTQMPAADQRRFEAVAGTSLARLGYAVEVDAPKVGAYEACYLNSEEFIFKAVRTLKNGFGSVVRR